MSVAVVTGSSRGIGRAIAQALEGAGWDVLYSSTRENLEGVKHYQKCDITKREDREALLASAKVRLGGVDMLVNNAGVAPARRMDILDCDEESFDRVLNTNLRSTFFMCQLFAKAMIEAGRGGRIVNISSISAYTSSTNRAEYCISKAGISMTTSLFADRLAQHGIGVFEVRPGVIMTDMTEAVQEKYQSMILEGLTPIKRLGRPEDVAACVLACAGGYLDFATGQVLNADGGFSIRRL